MKLMTYNILNGGEERLPLIKSIIKEVGPDYLTLNEANGFSDNNNKILNELAEDLKFEHYNIALSGEYDYHVAVFSRRKFTIVKKLQPLMRACLITSLKTKEGSLSVASLHLTPYTEDLRHPEIDLIIKNQKEYRNRILTGDMNSLSRYDGYQVEMVKDLNEMQLRKFTTDGKLRFDAIDKILSFGYHDVAVKLNKNSDYTAPTLINEHSAHSNMRLDYFFVSDSLAPKLASYSVVKNDKTEKASDHYPVVMAIEGL
ncbi:endonuclease/exonuclease/phosphatase family protein [Patescibacteria group bacterium]|nr:endonuclease/exonuclease/phosphatase family protein [Patescibacteria group bacterium]